MGNLFGKSRVLVTVVLIFILLTSAEANYPVGSMARGLVDEEEQKRSADGKVGVRGNFGEEDDEGECTAGQPVRIGNVTWSGSRKQTMEGIGASLVFYTNWITNHKNKAEIYDIIFGEMKPTILRMRNSWDCPNQFQTVNDILKTDSELFREATKRLSRRAPKVLLTSWSPPASLKENRLLLGTGNSVLIKGNKTDQFVYDKLADFWVVSGL
jgi:hypothetical protein